MDESSEIQVWLDRLAVGDQDAKAELIRRTCERLRRLARKMLRQNPRVQRWEQTDDILQQAVLKLDRALDEQHPSTVRDYFGFAALQIRRTLIDLARHHYGPMGQATHHQSDSENVKRACDSAQPSDLEEWTMFHEQVEKLPDAERETFGLLWYEGLTQEEAASILSVSVKTVKRRWQSAKVLMHDVLGKLAE